MKKKIFLILLITIITGIHTLFAQSGREPSAEPAAGKKTAEQEVVININLASDDEFSQALQTATDVELVNEETVKTEKSNKDIKQGK